MQREHYSARMRKEVEQAQAENQALRAGIARLVGYLNSPKFSADTSVNRDDVLLRLSEALSDATDVAVGAEG